MTIEEAKLTPLDKIEQQSFDNRKISLAKISHKHLSNCYWYSMFFQNPKILISTSTGYNIVYQNVVIGKIDMFNSEL